MITEPETSAKKSPPRPPQRQMLDRFVALAVVVLGVRPSAEMEQITLDKCNMPKKTVTKRKRSATALVLTLVSIFVSCTTDASAKGQ